MLLEGKKVLVTGASAGSVARRRSARRATGGTSRSTMRATTPRRPRWSARLRRWVAAPWRSRATVAEHATAGAFVSQAADTLGGLDVFVSNAGICPFHAFLDMPPETFERTMRVNLHGAYYMVQAAANRMVEQGAAARSSRYPRSPRWSAASSRRIIPPTKAGVHSLMQSTAIALGRHGIRCNSVLPGTILTDINKDDLADLDKRERMAARIPLGRLGEPDDLAGPIVFLASDMARLCHRRGAAGRRRHLREPAVIDHPGFGKTLP